MESDYSIASKISTRSRGSLSSAILEMSLFLKLCLHSYEAKTKFVQSIQLIPNLPPRQFNIISRKEVGDSNIEKWAKMDGGFENDRDYEKQEYNEDINIGN